MPDQTSTENRPGPVPPETSAPTPPVPSLLPAGTHPQSTETSLPPLADEPPPVETPRPGGETALTLTKPARFVCACEAWMRSACRNLPFYREHEGKQYCVLHLPTQDKAADFHPVFQAKLTAKNYN